MGHVVFFREFVCRDGLGTAFLPVCGETGRESVVCGEVGGARHEQDGAASGRGSPGGAQNVQTQQHRFSDAARGKTGVNVGRPRQVVFLSGIPPKEGIGEPDKQVAERRNGPLREAKGSDERSEQDDAVRIGAVLRNPGSGCAIDGKPGDCDTAPQPARKGDGFVGGIEHGLRRKRPELVSHQVGLSMSGHQRKDNIMAALEKDLPELVELLGGIGQPVEEDEDVFGGLIVEEGPRAAGAGEGLRRAGEQFFERDFGCVVIGGREACGNREADAHRQVGGEQESGKAQDKDERREARNDSCQPSNCHRVCSVPETLIDEQPIMKNPLPCWIVGVVLASVSGCAPLSQFPAPPRVREGSLTQAREWAASARRNLNAQAASEQCLAALRAALPVDSPQARDIANVALGRFIESNYEDGKLRVTEFTGPDGIVYHVRIAAERGEWPASLLNDLDPIRPARTRASAPLQWAGWGVPMIGVSEPDRVKQPFEPLQGYRLPVTVVADVRTRGGACETTIHFLNPENTKFVSLAGKIRPVAGDLYAPTIATFRRGNPLLLSLRWLFQVDRFTYPTNLIFMQPYDSERIPVVLVHGLLSTPSMWGEVVRQLEADPFIRKNFQFWAFFYPTGQPIPVSAMELRRDLLAVEARYRPPRGIVLVGHSMGGITARAQASSSGGPALFNQVFGEDAPHVAGRLPNAPILRDSLFFDRVESVRRVIFVCAPHRGSRMALAGPAGFFATLIRLPQNITGTIAEIADVVTTMDLRRPPTSIRGLSPKSPFLQALNQRPIEAPHHTIIGDRGRGDSPNSSDGVVPYSSAHLATAESELIIPAGHGAFRHPMAIAEIERILREHLARVTGPARFEAGARRAEESRAPAAR